jgi:hypothetical protein
VEVDIEKKASMTTENKKGRKPFFNETKKMGNVWTLHVHQITNYTERKWSTFERNIEVEKNWSDFYLIFETEEVQTILKRFPSECFGCGSKGAEMPCMMFDSPRRIVGFARCCGSKECQDIWKAFLKKVAPPSTLKKIGQCSRPNCKRVGVLHFVCQLCQEVGYCSKECRSKHFFDHSLKKCLI